VLAEVGRRALMHIVSEPTVELITATSADISYNIRACHYNRVGARPTTIGQVAKQRGAGEIVRSQFQNTNRVTVGFPPNVTRLVQPDPQVGYSPCLDISWISLGTEAQSKVELLITFTLSASGQDLPAY